MVHCDPLCSQQKLIKNNPRAAGLIQCRSFADCNLHLIRYRKCFLMLGFIFLPFYDHTLLSHWDATTNPVSQEICSCCNVFSKVVCAVIDATPALPSCSHRTISPLWKKVIVELCTAYVQCLVFRKYTKKLQRESKFYKTTVGNDEVMLSLSARQMLSLHRGAHTSISRNVPLYELPGLSPSDLIALELNSRGNDDKCFSSGSDFDRSLTIIISLTSPQARVMKSCQHSDPTEGAVHCWFTTSLGVTLRDCFGLQMRNNGNEDVLQLDDRAHIVLSAS